LNTIGYVTPEIRTAFKVGCTPHVWTNVPLFVIACVPPFVVFGLTENGPFTVPKDVSVVRVAVLIDEVPPGAFKLPEAAAGAGVDGGA
jgi:hypothetical protein